MLKLEINTGTAAFEDQDIYIECARLLRVAAKKILDGQPHFKLYDGNGNHVGFCDLYQD